MNCGGMRGAGEGGGLRGAGEGAGSEERVASSGGPLKLLVSPGASPGASLGGSPVLGRMSKSPPERFRGSPELSGGWRGGIGVLPRRSGVRGGRGARGPKEAWGGSAEAEAALAGCRPLFTKSSSLPVGTLA